MLLIDFRTLEVKLPYYLHIIAHHGRQQLLRRDPHGRVVGFSSTSTAGHEALHT